MEVVDDQDTSRLTYTGQWIASDASGADGGTIHSSSDSAAVVTLRFSGTSVQFDALRSQNGANFTVRLDNSLYGPYSLYGANATVTNVWSQDRLDPSVTHTIEIRKAQGASEALAINVDRFRIASVPSSTISSSTSSQGTSTSSSSTRSSSTSSLINQCPNDTTSSFFSSTSSSSSSSPTSSSPAMSFSSTTSLDVPNETPDVDSGQVDSVPDDPNQDNPVQENPTQENPTQENPTGDDPLQDSPSVVPNSSSGNTDELDDSLIASSSTRTSSTLSNSTISHSTTSHNTTSTPTLLSPLTHTPSSQGTSVPVTSNVSDSNLPAQSKTGVILGSVVAVVIAVSLLTILVVWIRRRRAKAMEDDLRPSTTPAYQTTTATKRILSPLGLYKHRISPSSSGRRYAFGRGDSGFYAETREYGFGSNSNQGNLGPSPVGHTQSSYSPPVGGASAEGRPLSSVEESAQYTFYPSTNAAQDSHTPRYAESVASDYPYTLAFHAAAPGARQ